MTATLVQLIDGSFVMSDAEEWRDQCLARHVLKLPTLDERRAWLLKFEQRHGPDIAHALKDRMTAIYEAPKSRNAPTACRRVGASGPAQGDASTVILNGVTR